MGQRAIADFVAAATPLTPEQETAFRRWARENGITDLDQPAAGLGLDVRAYWKTVVAKGGPTKVNVRRGLAQGAQGLDARQPTMTPPRVPTPLDYLGATGSATGRAMGALVDKPGNLKDALWEAGKGVNDAILGRGVTDPVTEMDQRSGVQTPALAALPLNAMTDIGNLLDPMKLMVPSAAILGGLKMVDDARTPLRSLASLVKRYPQTAKAVEKHAATVAIPGANRSAAAALDRLTESIYGATLEHGGATTYPLTGAIEEVGTPGYIVGRYSNQSGKTQIVPIDQFTPATVRAFIEKHADTYAKDPQWAVGAWTGAAPGMPKGSPPTHVYLDVSRKVPTARSAVTKALAQPQPKTTVRDPVTGEWPKTQEAVFNLKAGEDQLVGNFAEFAKSPEMQQRLDEMFEAGVPVMDGKEWWNLYGSSLERVYGKDRVAPLAGLLASTSPASAPVHNLRTASEYLRRLIKGEPIIQPGFRIPETAVGSREGMMGAMTPGDFNAPGTRMPMEKTRAPNLRRVEAGTPEQVAQDKVNDMFHALTGMDVGVYDRRYAKLFEDWNRGIFAESTKDKLAGSMRSGTVNSYALIENAVRDAAKRRNMPIGRYSAYVWEGIGDVIKKTGQLYGMKQSAHSIPEASQGFAGIFEKMIAEKAQAWGISVAEMEKRLRSGDAELLTALLATPAGLAAYHQWESEGR